MTSLLRQWNIVSTDYCMILTTPTVTPPLAEGPHRSVVSHTLYWMLSFLGVPDHKVGRAAEGFHL